MNWIDAVLILFLAICLIRGYQIGFVGSLFNLVVSVGSMVGSFFLYKPLTALIESQFGVPGYLAPVVTFGVILLFLNVVMHWVTALLWHMIDRFLRALVPLFYLDRMMGVVLQGALGAIIALVVVLLVFKLPVQAQVKEDLSQSYLVKASLPHTAGLEGYLRQLVGQLPTDALQFLIPRQPQSDETVAMVFPQSMILMVDSESERKMHDLVNMERQKMDVRPLLWDDTIVPVARAHSKDMFEGSYFSHVNPDGKTIGDRMQKGNVLFLLSGENLAYAPTVEIAHDGLMKSPGHRENILRAEFSRIGIGVIDGGPYGKMFTQNFAD